MLSIQVYGFSLSFVKKMINLYAVTGRLKLNPVAMGTNGVIIQRKPKVASGVIVNFCLTTRSTLSDLQFSCHGSNWRQNSKKSSR